MSFLVGVGILVVAGGSVAALAYKAIREAEDEEYELTLFLRNKIEALRPFVGTHVLVCENHRKTADGILLYLDEVHGIAYVDIRRNPTQDAPPKKDIVQVPLTEGQYDFYDEENNLI